MIIACDKETMKSEGRVALVPGEAKTLIACGAEILIARSAGVKSGYSDRAYKDSGAKIISRDSAWRKADLIVRVKQPLSEDFKYFRSGLMIACFGHLAANRPLLECLLNTGVTLIDYGTIQLANGSTHILAEMSKIAGHIAVVDGEYLLKKHRGKILAPGTNTAIVGIGNAGISAAKRVLPTGAMLYCFDKSPEALERARNMFRQFSPYQVWYLKYDHNNPEDQKQLAAILAHANLVIGATHEPARHTGNPVPAWMIGGMQKNSVVVDIAIDQGGCFESSGRFFRTGEQIFNECGVWHICKPNMPGAVPGIATPALCKETFPYIKEIASKGFVQAVRENPTLASGVMTHKGWVTHRGLAESVERMDRYRPLEELL